MSTRGRSSSPRTRDVDVDMDKPSDEKPDAKVVLITNLTRNVVEAHLQAIFGFYGEVVKIDLPTYAKSGQNKGKAALEYADATSARTAVSHMNGGQLDGAALKVELSDTPVRTRSRSPPFRQRNGRDRPRSLSRSRSHSPRFQRRERDFNRGYNDHSVDRLFHVGPLHATSIVRVLTRVPGLPSGGVARSSQGGGLLATSAAVTVVGAGQDPTALQSAPVAPGQGHHLVPGHGLDLLLVLALVLALVPAPAPRHTLHTLGAVVGLDLTVGVVEAIVGMISGIVGLARHPLKIHDNRSGQCFVYDAPLLTG
ncbi:hypothetical protein B0F90DRAFT_1665505 [Multifurca ochricompacta]|uniref:RRM domain-containing protein n=1 Tax=Multifurca ochricompacta TaxID=376703 RepID=A0AAD4MDP4_9AGAM|nr:hypothetical protein B0F90DRAFT_1665505 [Multifurca ochricompacta]